jgi:uncharacterized membrane protein
MSKEENEIIDQVEEETEETEDTTEEVAVENNEAKPETKQPRQNNALLITLAISTSVLLIVSIIFVTQSVFLRNGYDGTCSIDNAPFYGRHMRIFR